MDRRFGYAIISLTLLIAACGPEVVERHDRPQRSHDVRAPDVPGDGTDDVAEILDAFGEVDVSTAGPHEDTSIEDTQVTADTATAPKSYSVAIVADMNSSYGSTTYLNAVKKATRFITERLKPDVVLSAGDMVAGQKSGLDYRAMWSAFHSTVTDKIRNAGIPFAPTPGNHDASGYAAYQNERDIYVDEWEKKRPSVNFVEDTYYPLRYAFRVGPALFISLDDTTVGPLGDPQMMWLETVLENNETAPVKVVYGHLPLWGFAQGRADEIIGDDDLETLLEKHDVDLFVSGHHHAYYPGKRGKIRMLSMACLGTGSRKLLGGRRASGRSVAVFTYDRRGIRAIDAYEAPGFNQIVPRTSLPKSIDDGNAIIVRDDT